MGLKNSKFAADVFFKKYVLQLIPSSITANHVTVFRLICIPLVLLGYVTVGPWLAALLFMLAAASDYLDGLLARVRGMTAWGKLWDERADKFLVIAIVVFMMGVAFGQSGATTDVVLLGIAFLLVVLRDIIVTFARHKDLAIATVLWSAKVKAFVQMAACFALLLGAYSPLLFPTALSLYSGWIYTQPLREQFSM
jgi:phosphatidylglycerophosphate synthase